MNTILSVCSVAIVSAATVLAQSPISPSSTTSTSDILQQFQNQIQADYEYAETILGLADAYLEMPSVMDEALALTTAANVLARGWGERFQSGIDGFYAVGRGGALIGDYVDVYSSDGVLGIPLTNLHLRLLDATQAPPGSHPGPNPWQMEIQSLIYSAQFGNGPVHVGFATRYYNAMTSALVFVPGAEMPSGSILTPEDIVEFYAATIERKFHSDSFTEWALARLPSTQGLQANSNNPECNEQALRDCLNNALLGHATRSADINQRHRDNVDAIVQEWGDGSVDSFWGSLFAGAAVGGLRGAIGGPGAAAAAAGWGAVGAGVTWITSTSSRAKTARRKLAREEARWREERCQNVQQTAQEMRDCASQHCPQILPALNAWLAGAVASTGC